MDRDVDPCQDFYQHACGNFIRENPARHVPYSTRTPYTVQLNERLYRLLGEAESADDGKSMNAIKRQYRLCQSEDKLDADGLTALLKVINENGGWPMIVPDEFHPTKSVQEVQDEYNRKTGNAPLYTVLVRPRSSDSSDNAITVDQPSAFPKHQYNTSDPEAKFVKYIADVAAEFAESNGVTITEDRLSKDAKDVFDFIVQLAELRNSEDLREEGVKMKVSEAQEAITNGTASSFDLLSSLQKTYEDLPGVTLTEDEEINVRELNYLQGLIKLLDSTDPTVALNYVHFHFVENYFHLTTRAARKLVRDVYDSQPLNRTVSCAELPNVRRALGRLYVKKYMPASKLAAAKKVVDDMKAQIKAQIERSAFIDDETRPNALAKLDNLITIVGYDDSLSSDEKVESYYSQFDIGENLVENILNYHEVEYKKRLEKLRKPIVYQEVRENFYTDPTNSEGLYEILFNRLKLPGALFDAPLFTEDYPPTSNYAGIGSVIGGFLSHLYSSFGLDFDGEGHARRWYSSDAEGEFEKRDQCFVNQFSNTAIKELDDAGLTYSMNVLSMFPITASYQFALKTAYLAHRAMIDNPSAESGNHVGSLALNTTVDKQFFLNYATMYCETINPSKLLTKLMSRLQLVTTGRIKVNSAVSNLPEFSEVYGCAPNTPMNPTKKCTILD